MDAEVKATPRDEILKPLFFDGNGGKPIDCDPVDVFRDHRFQSLLKGSKYEDAFGLFENFFDSEADLAPEELDRVARAFRIALLTWHTKLAWLERVVEYQENNGAKPYDTSDLVRVITNAAEQFIKKLKRLQFQFVEDPRLNDDIFRSIWGQIERIHERVISVVRVKAAPVATGHRQKDLAGMTNLNTVTEFTMPPINADLFFGGSKRSDLACCTNGRKLLENLESYTLNPGEFDVICLKLSGRPVVMVVPRGTQGIIGLKELFSEVGILLSKADVGKSPDIFFLGMPDELFGGVEGIVQDQQGGIAQVDSGYKRFHHTLEDGSMIYVVGGGKDSKGRMIDYFGPFKKAAFQLVATRELQNATQLLAGTGRRVAQPSDESNPEFRYVQGERELSDEETFGQMVVPFHGTTLFWDNTGLDTDQVKYNLGVDRDTTVHHTLFEGQSGMGKSEMEQFIRVMLRNTRLLYEVMMESDNRDIKRRAAGLSNVVTLQLFSSGDDMGHMYVDPKTHRLVTTTHERGRFTRLDNVILASEIEARKTEPLDADGAVAKTSNTRVIQRDPELVAFHQIAMAARNFVISTNMPLEVDGFDDEAVVQRLQNDDGKSAVQKYLDCYAKYKNQPNGTKDTNDPVNSPGAMHEFSGQFATAGTCACENLVETRRFMLEREQERRQLNKQSPMQFFVINTGIAPAWLRDGDIQEKLDSIEDASERETEIQKIHFAHAASRWADVQNLLPARIRGAFQHAEQNLGVNPAKLAYVSEHWSEKKIKDYFRSLVTERFA